MRAKAKVHSIRVVLTVLFLVLLAASAHAENWVRVISDPGGDPPFTDIDKESIRKGSDGLVYFNAKDDNLGVSPSAVDCKERIFYVVGDGSRDWRGMGYLIRPGTGTDSEKEADFVCSG